MFRLIGGLFHTSVPIIVVFIFFLFSPPRSTWHINPQHLFSCQHSRPQQPRFKIFHCESIFAVPKSFKANDAIPADSIHECKHTRQNLYLQLCDQKWRIVNIDPQEPRIKMLWRQSLLLPSQISFHFYALIYSSLPWMRLSSTHLKLLIHNTTSPKIRLEEMHHAPFGGCRDLHQCFLVSDLCVCAMLLTP